MAHQNDTICRTTALSPNAAWDKALVQRRTEIRPCPPTALLDLHLALHLRRRVNADYQIDFLSGSWPIAPTKRAAVTLIHHPLRQFWAVAQPHFPLKTSGRKSWETTRCELSPFELPPTAKQFRLDIPPCRVLTS